MQSENQIVSMSQGPINFSIKNLFNGQKLTRNKSEINKVLRDYWKRNLEIVLKTKNKNLEKANF